MVNIMWFKRDLRTYDNVAFKSSAISGEVLPLYIIEPTLWQQPVMSARQYAFLLECLAELAQELNALGQPLIIKVGEAKEVFSQIHHSLGIKGVWSHQETWTHWTYKRDLEMKQWFQHHNIKWYEPVQNGVIRGSYSRDGWAKQWNTLMSTPLTPKPNITSAVYYQTDVLPCASELGLIIDPCPSRQTGGRTHGLALLRSFLYERGEYYSKEMSSPNTAFESCSRLSPYLAFGNLSLKEVYQATKQRATEVRATASKGKWLGALRSFNGRLHWHCHFIQKLEDEPQIEYSNMHPLYDGMREENNPEFLHAWQTGNTGYPMVDAAMRALIANGWINFRMRAMLVSFATYHLWLDWQVVSKHLARLFVDYEPGIHYSQIQMQAGTTGINSIRIYNPIKQSIDHDPNGTFIKQYIPQLSVVPEKFIHTPWEYTLESLEYPHPIVDEVTARKEAASKIFAIRKLDSHKTTAKHILETHGRRKKKNKTNSQ